MLNQIRGYAINVKHSQYRSALGRITSYSKCFKTLGKEFRSKVTRHGKNMYSNITSNKSPYRQVSYYTSYGNKVVHLHKNSKAYKLFMSSIYKNTIAVSTLLTAGGIGAIKGLKNGLSSTGKRTVYINPNNPRNYAFAGAGGNGQGIAISISLPDIREFAMTLSKKQQVALGYAFATDGVVSGGPSNQNKKGVGGKGWRGDKTWRNNVKKINKGGTIKDLNGIIPTKEEAISLINEAGGKVVRIEGPHNYPNPHNFKHINYVTSTGKKGTVQIK